MRLGDLDALMHHFMDKPPEYYHTSYIVGEINIAPTVDAVPVVRCEDCWHGVILYSDNDPIDGYCRLHNIAVTKEFFCADGKRRDCENG